MIASSTTIEMERVNASKVNKFNVNPLKYKIINVPSTDVGIENKIFNAD